MDSETLKYRHALDCAVSATQQRHWRLLKCTPDGHVARPRSRPRTRTARFYGDGPTRRRPPGEAPREIREYRDELLDPSSGFSSLVRGATRP